MKRWIVRETAAALALATLVAVGLWAQGGRGAGTLVNKLSAYGYQGQCGEVKIVVDTDIARFRGGEKFVPLVVYLGHTERRTLYATRGSFTLVDPSGAKLPVPGPADLLKGYTATLISADYSLIRNLTDYAGMVYLACRYIDRVAFFPNPSGPPGILYDQVEIPNRTYFSTVLYFPNPAGRAAGNYTLSYDDFKSKTRLDVPFPIEWRK